MGLQPMDEAGELDPYCASAAVNGRRRRANGEGGRGGALELTGRVRNSLEVAGKRGAHQGGCSTQADVGAKGMPMREQTMGHLHQLMGQ
jgi:hypothetical protein